MKKEKGYNEYLEHNKMIKLIKKQLGVIDTQLSIFIRHIVVDTVTNPDIYYLKTSYEHQCYVISIYSTETKGTAKHELPVIDLMEKIQKNKIEMEFNIVVKKMLIELKEKSNIGKTFMV